MSEINSKLVFKSETGIMERDLQNKIKEKNYPTDYKAPEDFPQWEAPENTFDLQQFMQEIM